MTDRTTKALLFMIALALWVNLFQGWFHPQPIVAAQLTPGRIPQYISPTTIIQHTSTDHAAGVDASMTAYDIHEILDEVKAIHNKLTFGR
jgi:hypothetical protein